MRADESHQQELEHREWRERAEKADAELKRIRQEIKDERAKSDSERIESAKEFV